MPKRVEDEDERQHDRCRHQPTLRYLLYGRQVNPSLRTGNYLQHMRFTTSYLLELACAPLRPRTSLSASTCSPCESPKLILGRGFTQPPWHASPECVEGEFCELRLYGVLRSSHSPGPMGPERRVGGLVNALGV